jgi:hypothetical protein
MNFKEIISTSEFVEKRKKLEDLTYYQLLKLAEKKGEAYKNILKHFSEDLFYKEVSKILGISDIYEDYIKECKKIMYSDYKKLIGLHRDFRSFIIIKICFEDL